MIEPAVVAAVRPVAEALESLGVAYHVGGSLASSAHGVPRASIDADLIADLEPAHVEPLVGRLASTYYVPADSLRAAVAERRSVNLIHLETMFKIDLFVSRRRPFDREVRARARPEAFGEPPEARRFPVASAEDTVLAKLEWFRAGGETSERQWSDVVGVLKVATHADEAYLRTWARELGVEDLLETARSEAAR